MSSPTPPGGSAPDEISYADAIREIERLLERIEDSEIDVDLLTTAVERAAYLLQVCRARIERAETHIVKVLADVERQVPEEDE